MEQKRFYFLHENNQYGPYSLAELSKYAISPETLFWFEGMENWQPASSIPELASLFQQKKPTPPPPPPPSSPPPGFSDQQYNNKTIEQEQEQQTDHSDEPDYDLQPPELSVLTIFGQTSGGLFGNKPKFGNRLTRFYLVHQFQMMMEQSAAGENISSATAGEMAAQEMAEGILGLVSKGLATENQKGVVLTQQGFDLIDRSKQ